ncbi:unnamed protein product, partial [Mesorhabditis spiculigera]
MSMEEHFDVSRSSNAEPPTALDALEAKELDHGKKGLILRGMDRLRRSIRQSLRRKKSIERPSAELVQSSSSQVKNGPWQPDEASVRAGLCSFQVKYLGSTEVYESRGMTVCEAAMKTLKANKRRPIKAMLYVSGDGLRVVDQQSNRGLLVDQTIEKVSFCAPDRNNARGFAYICRDGTTRRWLCHGFLSSKESGERLSHAVGCAFSVCLEKKRKRDEETTVVAKGMADKALNPDWDDKPSGSNNDSSWFSPSTSADPGNFQRGVNPAYTSIRKAPMSERLQDPQAVIISQAANTAEKTAFLDNIAKPRPAANPQLFLRQGSLRAPESAQSFRRQFSLRPFTGNSFDGNTVRPNHGVSLFNEPIYEGDEDPEHRALGDVPTGRFWHEVSAPGSSPAVSPFPNGAAPQVQVPVSIPPDSTGSSQNELGGYNPEAMWNEALYGVPKEKRAEDWLENALRNINISPSSSNEQNVPPSPGTLYLVSQARGAPGGLPTAILTAPPPIPARPAISKDVTRIKPPPVTISDHTEEVSEKAAPGTGNRWDSPETVQWEHPPQNPQGAPSDDPFDVQWSRVALGPQVNI